MAKIYKHQAKSLEKGLNLLNFQCIPEYTRVYLSPECLCLVSVLSYLRNLELNPKALHLVYCILDFTIKYNYE